MRVGLGVAVVTLVLAVAVIGANAASPAETVILYQDAVSAAPPGGQPIPVELWTTDGNGRNARRVAVLRPADGGFFWGAHLAADGAVVYAVRSRRDPQVANIFLLGRGAKRGRLLFGVRGLRQFVLSPDGRKLAYTRELPVAGKPLLVVAQLDGSRPHVVAHAVGKTLSWSADGKTLFAYGLLPRCWMCAVSVATGATRPIPLDYRNLQGVPAISPSGARLAFCDLKGPAGERVFTVSGTFLRNIAGFCGNEAFWSPDETRLIFYDTDELFVFDFATRTIQSFQHAGPSDLRVLGWAVAGRR